MRRAKDPKKEIRGLDKELNSYKGTLRDASFLFEDKVLELSLLKRVGNILGYILDLESFYRMFLDILIEETNAKNCSFMLMDTETDRLVLKMARGRNDGGTFFDHPRDSGVTFSLGEGVAGRVALERKTILVDDTNKDTRFEAREPCAPIGSLLCTPLIFQEKVLGVINLSHSLPHAFSQNNKRIMELLCAFVSSILGNAIDYIKAKDQEKFIAMFEGVKLPILLIDPETNHIIDCNKYTKEWLGYSLRELVRGKYTFDMLLSGCREEAEQIVHEIVENNNSGFNELSFKKKDGSITIGEISGTVISYRGKDAIQLLIRDINERIKAEEALKKSEEKYHDLLENASDAIISTNRDGVIIDFNKKAEEIFGYAREEVVEQSIFLLFAEEYRERERNALGKFKSTGQLGQRGKTIEREGLRKDGQKIPLESSWSLLEVEEDYIFTAIVRDVTERKKAEKELSDAKDFLENVIETIGDGLLICDEKGQILLVNTALEKLYGYKREEMIGHHTSILTVKEDKALRGKILQNIVELYEKGNVSHESLFKGQDGRLVEIECNSSMIKDSEGNYIAGVSVFRDISERKKAAREISEAKEFLESIIENSRDGIFIVDEKGYIISVNNAFVEMCKFKKEELVGEHVSCLTVEDEALRKMIREKTGELFEKGFAFYESRHKIKGGGHTNVECNCSMIKDDKGSYIAGVSIIRDITDRRKMEQQLLQSEKLKSLGELAGGVAHDFNNVLAAILGRAQLLKMIVDSPPKGWERRKSVDELKKGLEVIEKASLDGAETVRRIQEFARAREDDKYFAHVDLNDIIDSALEFTKAKWKDDAESKGIRIHIKKEFSTLPHTLGSAAELREVFTNLINNAVDAMPGGGEITINTYKEDRHIVVKVADTGVGVADDRKDRIFDPFFTTKGVKATGLGMSVSYGIIHRHRGTIAVESVEGEGTTFTIKFPIVKKVGARKAKGEKIIAIKREQKKARILLIEDEKDVRQLLKDILTNAGHDVQIAKDGGEGIEMFKKNDFDLVFTDLGMPGMSGWEVAKKVKKISRRIPVVLITGWNVELDETEMKERGIDFIIKKPYKLDQLVNVVQEGMILRDKFKAV